MLACFTDEKTKTIPIVIVKDEEYAGWLQQQSSFIQNWLSSTNFQSEAGRSQLIPDERGNTHFILCCISKETCLWDVGLLPLNLPEGVYELKTDSLDLFAIGWGLGAYQFTRYKKATRKPAQLYLPSHDKEKILNVVAGVYLVRDLINTPTDDMGPSEFAAITEMVAKKFNADLKQIVGNDLLKANYAAIHTVGRASDDAPRLLDLTWGNENHPKVTLVGKGVCFDSGGLDIKPAAMMLLMKKDMGGAAHTLALAQMIMTAKLPVRLRLLMPVVENVISGNSYRPGDVIKSRSGLTIEVGNTDAEGRVILADALAEAVKENPDLLIDIATLTGAARIALGTELPALFANNDDVANALIKTGFAIQDPMWRLPLFAPYRQYIKSSIADINNSPETPFGGAILAALFLQNFVPHDVTWLHFDMMAWNGRTKPGRPEGGEAMALRALFAYLSERFGE